MMPFLYIFMIIMIEHPSAGGLVNVTYLLLGDKIGLFITYLIIFSLVLLVPIVGIIGANYICYLLNINNNLNILIAWFLLFFFTLINTLDTKISLRIQGISSILLLFFLFTIIIISLSGSTYKFIDKLIDIPFNYNNFEKIWIGMTLVFWAFLGWENLSFTTEEFENIKRDFKRVVMLSFIIMMCLYLGLSAGVITWLDSSSSRTMSAPLAEVIYVALGYRSGIAAAIIAVLIMLININAWVWGPSRLVYDAGRKKIIPDKLANLNRHHSPHYALYILFIFYTISLLLIYLMGDKFMLIAIKQVNCIFLLLYILSIMGYLKSCNTLFHKTVGSLAMGLFILFLLQFGLYLILPVIFFALIFIKNHFQKNIYKKRVKQGF